MKKYSPVLTYHSDFPESDKISEDINRLSVLQPWKFILAAFTNYFIITICAICCHLQPTIAVYAISWIIIGSRQHANLILIHDTSHGLFLKNKTLADLLTNWLLVFPLLFFSLEKYRVTHGQHHRFLNTEKDPDWFWKKDLADWKFPMKKKKFYLILFKIFIGYGFFMGFQSQKNLEHKIDTKFQTRIQSIQRQKYFFWIILLSLMIVTQNFITFLLLWLIPLLTTMMCFERLRSISDHFGLSHSNDFTASRTMKSNFLQGFLFGPYNIHYHLEHHLYPTIPFYNLNELAHILREKTDFSKRIHKNSNYFGRKDDTFIHDITVS